MLWYLHGCQHFVAFLTDHILDRVSFSDNICTKFIFFFHCHFFLCVCVFHAGAHSRLQPIGKSKREARVQTLFPDAWMEEVETRGHGTRSIKPLSLHQR